MSAAFSSFENSFYLMNSFIQFAGSLQINLFSSLVLFLGTTPLVFWSGLVKLFI